MGKIKYLLMDVDGTLTDGKIYMGNDGEVMKAFNVKDGCGIVDVLLPNGIIPIIITGRTSQILVNRCKEIGVSYLYQGISNKLDKICNIVENLSEVAYIGDDLNDLLSMKAIKEAGGLIGCPKNSARKIKEIADYVSEYNGGDGAVRDFIEWIVEIK